MNFHSPTSKGGLHRALRVLSILLLQHALGPIGSDAYARTRLPNNADNNASEQSFSRPYLRVAGSLPLRFKSAPPSIAPVVPKPVAVETPAKEISVAPLEPLPEKPVHEIEQSSPTVETVATPTPPPVYRSAPNIIPDDTRPAARAEDFLPYFRFPSGGDVSVPAPANASQPGQLPASSATYQQR